MHLALSFLLAASVWAQQAGTVAGDRWCGLNDTDPAATIPDCACQDCLNVEASIHGTSLRKRHGYTLEGTLSYSTSPVTGAAYFIDPNGNNVIVVCNDVICSKSNNSGTFASFLTTATATPTYWSMVDNKGILYGANDKQDKVFLYNNSTLVYSTTIPRGKLLELSQDRLISANTSANPNRVYYSKSGDFTEWNAGIYDYSPWYDDIGTNGSQITGLKLWKNDLFIFQETSITDCFLGTQYTTICSLISNKIGTIDPQSILLGNDGLYFRGSDNAFWHIATGGLEIISLPIKNLLDTVSVGKAQSNTQSSQADWEAGTLCSSGADSCVNTTISPGDVSLSTWVSPAGLGGFFFATAISSNATHVVLGSNLRFANIGFENGTLSTWTQTGTWAISAAAAAYDTWGAATACESFTEGYICVLDASNNVILSTGGNQSGEYWIDTSTLIASMKLKISAPSAANCVGTQNTLTSGLYSPAAQVRFSKSASTSGCSAGFYKLYVDLPEKTTYYVSAGTYTSPTYNTHFSTPIPGQFSSTFTVSSGETELYFDVRFASSEFGAWTTWAATSDTLNVGTMRQYAEYRARFYTSNSTMTPTLSSASVSAATTGQYITQCIETTGISSYGSMSCGQSVTGTGAIVYAATSAASCAALPTSTGVWTTQTNNATLTIATAPATALRAIFSMAAASETATLNSCSIYWQTGSPSPPVWGLFDSARNAFYWSFAADASATNNRILKYDLYGTGWWPFSIPASAMLNYNNYVYFGGSTAGKWYKYGNASTDADDGAVINGYFKTKDFSGGNPFTSKTWQKIDLLSINQYNGVISSTWTYETGKTGTYDIDDSTTSTLPYIKSNSFMPLSSPSRFINLKFGNAYTNSPFEIMGYKIDFVWNPAAKE